jgi:hypothetical protein
MSMDTKARGAVKRIHEWPSFTVRRMVEEGILVSGDEDTWVSAQPSDELTKSNETTQSCPLYALLQCLPWSVVARSVPALVDNQPSFALMNCICPFAPQKLEAAGEIVFFVIGAVECLAFGLEEVMALCLGPPEPPVMVSAATTASATVRTATTNHIRRLR